MNPALRNRIIDDTQVQKAMAHALNETPTVSRRWFLKLAGVSGGGLALAFYFGDQAQAQSAPTAFAPNAFVQIDNDGSILIYSKGPEIGQGIKTAFALIIAEELDADWQRVHVEQAPINPAVYGRQGAGGSTSIPSNWDQLRQAGAVARAMLVSAAAREWQIPEAECRSSNSTVICKDGRTLGYGALAGKAAALPVPDAKLVRLKERSQYQLFGKRYGGVDNLKVVTGQPLFGIDTVLPNMLYAAYEKCPAFGGKVQSANLDAIKQLPGVKDAFVVAGTGLATEVMPGVAIIATSTWAAFNAKRQLQIVWDESTASKDSWNDFVTQAKSLATHNGKETLRNAGDVDQIFASAQKQVEAFYSYPFAAHATLEPQNCTAWYREGGIEIWAPSQQADQSIQQVARLLNLSADRITVHQTRVGGGFGRRLLNDYVCEVAIIAREVAKRVDAPVKLTWTREDDMTHDLYRVGGFHAFKGAVDAQGKLAAWQDHFISFTADGQKPVSGGNIEAEEFPGQLLPHFRLTQTLLNSGTPTGPLRAPRSNAIAFAVQCFLHELAVASKRDHVEFLLEIMGEPRWLNPGNIRALNTGRAAAVIKLAAEKSGWGSALPKGRGLGLAFHFSHAGHVAEVAEVSVDRNRKLTLHKVTVVSDVGPIINLSGAEAQAQGAVTDGFSLMFAQQIIMDKGRVQQQNFNQYSLLRMPHAPQVEVHFIQSDYNPTGLGEPTLPPLAPAVCNAIFAATGERVRSLPLSQHGFRLA
ncbi:MAG: molybdopterin cofactor-binding domain-containing protein [Steroidobacteraceae bacterium]